MILRIVLGIIFGAPFVGFAFYFIINVWREFDDIGENIGMTILGCFIAFLGMIIMTTGFIDIG